MINKVMIKVMLCDSRVQTIIKVIRIIITKNVFYKCFP